MIGIFKNLIQELNQSGNHRRNRNQKDWRDWDCSRDRSIEIKRDGPNVGEGSRRANSRLGRCLAAPDCMLCIGID